MCATSAKIHTARARVIAVPRPLSFVHRWLGICVGFIFALWFVSGAILVFVPFPELSDTQRIVGSELVDFAKVRISPREALATASGASVEGVRLVDVAGEPRYVLSVRGGPAQSISASSGRRLGLLTPAAARSEAASFSDGRVVGLRGPFDYDQWTVHDQYDPFRPFYVAHIQDEHGTENYVSARSGQVLQRTERFQREWNQMGAVVHWANFVGLRRHKTLWRSVMLALGLACTALVVLGTGLGVVHLINARRVRRNRLSAFRGWLRWHHIGGIFTAVILLSLVVSGCLILDAGTIFPSSAPTVQERAAIRGMTLQAAAGDFPLAALQRLPPSRQVEISAIGGSPLLIFWDALGHSHLTTVSAQRGLSFAGHLPFALLGAAVQRAWPKIPIKAILPVPVDDPYRMVLHPVPVSTVRISLADAQRTWVEIDSATGRIVSVTDFRSRASRWWVYGLHDLDFPWIDRAGPLRQVLIVLASAVGFAFTMTGLVLGVKRLRR